MKLYVLVPCFNEIKTINKIINNLVKIKEDIRIILIDDGSNDGTKELIYKNIKKKIYRFIDLKKNSGKGHAIKKAKKLIKYNKYKSISSQCLSYSNNLDYKFLDYIK